MQVENPKTKLKEAADLLSMLEHLFTGFSKQELDSPLPWDGILLTLRQSRMRLDEFQQNGARQSNSTPAPRSTSLASRIQKLPPAKTPQVREISMTEADEGVS